ncbi:MAG: hypothetical protein IPJ88_03580 [Myxococcales bacterium]|nr:MAG: hypothetical protein IPJ88_03580 [Myxococcales bacterium]
MRRRALTLLEFVEHHSGSNSHALHFVGHSTGGLDVRLLLTPGVKLGQVSAEDSIAARTKTAITLGTPHYGTPLANTLTNLNGRNWLMLVTALATSKPGRYTLYGAARALTLWSRVDDFILGHTHTLLDSIVERLIKDIKPDADDSFFDFVRSVGVDQGALVQLTPESIDLFNAAVLDRADIDNVSFATAAPFPKPYVGWDPYKMMSRGLFALSYSLARREQRQYPYPDHAYELLEEIRNLLPFELDRGTNDGVVPTLSQLWGRFGGIAVADHLDVVGQFPHDDEGGVHYPGWLHSGSNFSKNDFAELWSKIAAVIANA